MVRAAALIALLVAGCSVPDKAAEAPATNPDLDASTIQPMRGNDGHNRLASGSAYGRAIDLANAVKAIEGKPSCSGIKTLFKGTVKSDSYWAVRCHDGTDWLVAVSPKSTTVASCDQMAATLKRPNDCWTKF